MSNADINEEVKNVINFLGRSTDKGEVKDLHLQKILAYLIEKKQEDYNKTLGKLALTITMDKRRIRENYLEGIEYWDLMRTYIENNTKYWEWIGTPKFKELSDNPKAQPYLEAKKRLQENETNY